MFDLLAASAPALLLLLLTAWGGLMKRRCKFTVPPEPTWPLAENPGLAMELADSLASVDRALGRGDTKAGESNRRAARLLQYLDFVFIPLYTMFFAAVGLSVGHGIWRVPVMVLAVVTAIFDVVEDIQILKLLAHSPGASAKRFGQLKWVSYFATTAAAGLLFFTSGAPPSARQLAGMALGVLMIATAYGGIVASVKAHFAGILSATRLSVLGLLGLAAAPWIAMAPASFRVTAEYIILLRVPMLVATLLVALPLIAFYTGARSLLRGLFDLTPVSLFAVAMTSVAVAGTAAMNAYVILSGAHDRFGIQQLPDGGWRHETFWMPIVALLSMPLIVASVAYSSKQSHNLLSNVIAALSGLGLLLAVAFGVVYVTRPASGVLAPATRSLQTWLEPTGLFTGYFGAPGSGLRPEHLMATIGLVCGLLLYGILGFYGYTRLGKSRTVPALCSALMLVMMIGWILSAVAFFFDGWRIPVLLIVIIAGTLTAQSRRSDHYYRLRQRTANVPAPTPAEAILAPHNPCVIVAAANGGGIQAGAWAAQVLYGLDQDCPEAFRKALRMISSVSGGSVGSACFVHWLADQKRVTPPDKAAAASSLDEVAWGLAWTDFLRALLPWLFGPLIGRGRALEKVFCLNSANQLSGVGDMDKPLSDWNERVRTGELPAVVMNATIAETGERLLFATTRLEQTSVEGSACVDASKLHTVNGEPLDVAIATAARLSASFPYVTPAARSDGPGPQPHVVDGGYYDNYGMSTLVEWLDEALLGAKGKIERVMVLQIHGAPVAKDMRAKRYAKSRGWFYQAFAPLTTLAATRSAGQTAHNDIELQFLQQKWGAAGVDIETITFEFCNDNAPLSWHLTPEEVREIGRSWREDMTECRSRVASFLAACDRTKSATAAL